MILGGVTSAIVLPPRQNCRVKAGDPTIDPNNTNTTSHKHPLSVS